MALANDTLRKVIDKLYEIPDVHFETDSYGLGLQAHDNATARRIRKLFPGAKWKRKYSSVSKWWEWNGEWEGVKISIYAIYETPKECKAITKTIVVKKNVPVEFEEREVEETVIVGWDCASHTKEGE
jgi:hypothetical protein